MDSASVKYSLQTKLDRQKALIFILQQAMYLCVALWITAEVSQILVSWEMPIYLELGLHAASGTLFVMQYSWVYMSLYSGC